MIRRGVLGAVVLAALSFIGCKKAPPADGVCSYDPLPAGAEVPFGQGGVQVMAATDSYFYAFDGAGKQIAYQGANRLLPLKPGDYQIKINNTTHPVSVQSKTLAKCASGTVLGTGKTDEYYYIFDGAGTQLAYEKLGKALSLFPGKYQGRLNNTSTPVDVSPNATIELKSGLLDVLGSTDEYYYVFNSTGTQLAYNKLGKALSFVEGAYSAKINNVAIPVRMDPSRTNEYQTGTLTVKGSGSDYYYVFDGNGTQLGYNKLNQALSFPAGSYSVKVGNNTRPATVTAGQAVAVNW